MEAGWGCCSQPHAKVLPSPRPREEESEANRAEMHLNSSILPVCLSFFYSQLENGIFFSLY